MNRRLTSILLLAFVVALLSSYVVYRISAGYLRPAPQTKNTKILVAARDLQIGAVIRDVDVTTAEWVGPLPKGALVAKAAAVGRGVVSDLYQGEPIVDNRLAAPGMGGGLAATIPQGMRACAVRVDDVVGVAGFVVPGMRVDVLMAGSGPGAVAGPKVKTLLQNIRVLSAGTNIQRDNEGKPVQVQVVNLLVSPEQAELLSLAASQAKIQLVLRNPLDTDTPNTPSVAMAGLFSEGEATPPPPKPKAAVLKKPIQTAQPPPARVFLIEVFNGGRHTEAKFADTAHKSDAPQQPDTPQQ